LEFLLFETEAAREKALLDKIEALVWRNFPALTVIKGDDMSALVRVTVLAGNKVSVEGVGEFELDDLEAYAYGNPPFYRPDEADGPIHEAMKKVLREATKKAVKVSETRRKLN
jgi:hypothetical protein